MAYSEELESRIDAIVGKTEFPTKKKMFGGLAFMVDGHMCVGIIGEKLMARVGPDAYAAALKEEHVTEMDFSGKPLRGYVYVLPEGVATEEQLERWVRRCLTFVNTLPPKR